MNRKDWRQKVYEDVDKFQIPEGAKLFFKGYCIGILDKAMFEEREECAKIAENYPEIAKIIRLRKD